MSRPALPPAMKDALLAAVVAKLPDPGKPFTSAEREAWFDMMRKAVDVAYGPCERPVISIPTVFLPSGSQQLPPQTVTLPGPGRYYIDHDGFAMCDSRPIDPTDLPASAILWDERSGIDHGNADAIMWKTGGSNKQRLPAGVQLRAAEARHVNGEATP